MNNKINQVLERLYQWAGFPPTASSAIQRLMAYAATVLFLACLILPALRMDIIEK